MMNATQLKYARERVSAIYRRRKEKINAEAVSSRTLSDDEKLDMLEGGEFTVDRDNLQYKSWYQAVNFKRAVSAISAEEQAAKIRVLDAEYEALVDKLVLGDATEALALIASFEAGA